MCAAKVVGATFVDLVTDPQRFGKARVEFGERTGGGMGGSSWVAPLLPRDFQPPVGSAWPEHVTTVRREGRRAPDVRRPAAMRRGRG